VDSGPGASRDESFPSHGPVVCRRGAHCGGCGISCSDRGVRRGRCGPGDGDETGEVSDLALLGGVLVPPAEDDRGVLGLGVHEVAASQDSEVLAFGQSRVGEVDRPVDRTLVGEVEAVHHLP